MKVILNEDVRHLGEMGDVKNVAAGYFRNYLFPRRLAVPCTPDMEAYFKTRSKEIEARREQKRRDSMSLRERLEALEVTLFMPAGSNGKLFGAVTSQTLSDFYSANGFDIERKQITLPSRTIKNTGTYSVKVHLYETQVAEVKVVVKAQGENSAEHPADTAQAAPSEETKTQGPEVPSETPDSATAPENGSE